MADSTERSLHATPEQLLYARILEKGMYFGLLILLITYALYAFGIVKPYIPLSEIPKLLDHGCAQLPDHGQNRGRVGVGSSGLLRGFHELHRDSDPGGRDYHLLSVDRAYSLETERQGLCVSFRGRSHYSRRCGKRHTWRWRTLKGDSGRLSQN